MRPCEGHVAPSTPSARAFSPSEPQRCRQERMQALQQRISAITTPRRSTRPMAQPLAATGSKFTLVDTPVSNNGARVSHWGGRAISSCTLAHHAMNTHAYCTSSKPALTFRITSCSALH